MKSLIVLLVVLAVPAIVPAAEPWPPRFGPLVFGMGIDEVLAATPGTQWRVLEASPYTDRIFRIEATGLVDFAGIAFDTTVNAPHRSGYWITFEKERPAARAMECESLGLALMEDLEARYVPLAGQSLGLGTGGSGVSFTTTRLPGGALVVQPVPGAGSTRPGREQQVKVGSRSTATVIGLESGSVPVSRKQALKKDPAEYFVRARAVVPGGTVETTLHANAHYRRGSPGSCLLRVEIGRGAFPRTQETYPFDAAKLLQGPSIARRNRDLRGLPDLPQDGVTLRVSCQVRQSDGAVVACKESRDRGVDPILHGVALAWAERHVFDVTGLDPDDTLGLDITIPIHLSPAERRDVDLETGALLDNSKARWKRGRYRDASDFYPPTARRAGVSGIEVYLSCKVQEDGSLICGQKPGSPAPPPEFLDGAIRLIEQYEMEPVLTDGTPAAGFIVHRKVNFRLGAE